MAEMWRGRAAQQTDTSAIALGNYADLAQGNIPMRVEVTGKHLRIDSDRHTVRGVTYGSFLPRADGARYPDQGRVRLDLEAMSAMGFNTIRTYDLPPIDLLQTAEQLGLRLLVGLHYDDWRYETAPGRAANQRVVDRGRRQVEAVFKRLGEARCRPSTVLAVSVGNEVPGDLVRVHGTGAVEQALSKIIDEVHHHDAEMLATYTNYPTTEYLNPRNQDLATFNVFLEDSVSFEKYLNHLQVATGSRPLVITELGLASGIHGVDRQADVMRDQLSTIDEVGCAGATVFAWTDEWGVDGEDVPGWGFGLTDENRTPKPAAAAAMSWARSSLKDVKTDWPRVSVVVCAYNEENTIVECLGSLERSDYPDLEVIICDDGSTDANLELARQFPFSVLPLPHGGLSRARNAGSNAATGDVVAYLDADAMCHPQWPWYLALAFNDDSVSAVGGPNLPVPGAGLVERAVALSPGSPTEVLTGDDRAEHIAGCNMAFRAGALRAAGGFNPLYTSAGDDVDVCWKLLDRGLNIAFTPAAQVLHHRRATVSGYLKQQRGYGRAEALLAGAHPGRFNRLGQARWSGFIYGGVGLLPRLLRPIVYHGHQGSAPFQPISVHRSSEALSWATALLPAAVAIGVASVLLSSVIPAFGVLAALVVAVVVAYAVAVGLSVDVDRHEPQPVKLRALVAALHVAQPLVRTWGRLKTRRSTSDDTKPLNGGSGEAAAPATWSGERLAWLVDLEARLRQQRLTVLQPGADSQWDLMVPLGLFATAAITTGVAWEWTPQVRVGYRPRWPLAVVAVTVGVLAVTWPAAATVVFVLAFVGVLVAVSRARAARSVVEASMAAAERGATSVPAA